jgi:hypothetical protein
MAECKGLALVTLAKLENDQVNLGELARVGTVAVCMALSESLSLPLACPSSMVKTSGGKY